jgi:hypothetical protein
MSIKDLNITVSGMNNLEIKDLFNELKISEKNIGSDISYKFVGENSRIEILQILEKYGISTLENVVEYMKKHKTTLFNIIIDIRSFNLYHAIFKIASFNIKLRYTKCHK